jgi:hypothetical protein
VFAPPPDDDGKGVRMEAKLFSAGDRLPFGVEAFPGLEPPYDVLLWIESHPTHGPPADRAALERALS